VDTGVAAATVDLMALRPDFSRHRANPRFDEYRDRVGRLFRGESHVGLVLVRVEPYALQAGGHLWWRRWSTTRDRLWLWSVVDRRFSDDVLPNDAVEDELADYDAGRYRHDGEILRVEWTTAEESARLRADEFGL
jgi:hypothetical protein